MKKEFILKLLLIVALTMLLGIMPIIPSLVYADVLGESQSEALLKQKYDEAVATYDEVICLNPDLEKRYDNDEYQWYGLSANFKTITQKCFSDKYVQSLISRELVKEKNGEYYVAISEHSRIEWPYSLKNIEFVNIENNGNKISCTVKATMECVAEYLDGGLVSDLQLISYTNFSIIKENNTWLVDDFVWHLGGINAEVVNTKTYTDWKAAYKEQLSYYVKERNYKPQYTITDINKDGIPEMIVRFGYFDTDYTDYKIFTFKNNKIVFIGSGSGHPEHYVLYEMNNESYLKRVYGHMAYEVISKIEIVNDVIKETVISERTINAETEEYAKGDKELAFANYDDYSLINNYVSVSNIEEYKKSDKYLQARGYAGSWNNIYYLKDKSLYHYNVSTEKSTLVATGVSDIYYPSEQSDEIYVKLENTYKIYDESYKDLKYIYNTANENKNANNTVSEDSKEEVTNNTTAQDTTTAKEALPKTGAQYAVPAIIIAGIVIIAIIFGIGVHQYKKKNK